MPENTRFPGRSWIPPGPLPSEPLVSVPGPGTASGGSKLPGDRDTGSPGTGALPPRVGGLCGSAGRRGPTPGICGQVHTPQGLGSHSGGTAPAQRPHLRPGLDQLPPLPRQARIRGATVRPSGPRGNCARPPATQRPVGRRPGGSPPPASRLLVFQERLTGKRSPSSLANGGGPSVCQDQWLNLVGLSSSGMSLTVWVKTDLLESSGLRDLGFLFRIPHNWLVEVQGRNYSFLSEG